MKFVQGDITLPSSKTDVLYFLSHHVMERRFNQRACGHMLRFMRGHMKSQGHLEESPGQEDEEADAVDAAVHDDESSDDEAVLPARAISHAIPLHF